jgi:murein DD-endopeptidase MepM/ murein hydrolase activator NlpD
MADKAIFEIIVTSKGLKITQKEVDELGNSVKRSTKNTRDASKAQDDFNYKLNQGASGVSSAARSFSKLNQAIGSGPNGLVGAYATLAANAFAVSAAFNTLRNAAQVEQMMRGLEVQGARTGKSLVTLSKDVQKLTGYSIGLADSMKATALMTSAGFSSKGIEDLTKVAYNAALALGRNVPDALDRISKGVAKLEPELLDELGIMTKLSEAQSKYALQNNKSTASLTSFEKRQAMLNAVVAEGTAKFGGLSDQVESNPFDQLAASFQDLTNNILRTINLVAGPIASIFSNQGVLLGGIILFVSTIRQQLLPALYLMGKVARDRREYFLGLAADAKNAAKATLELANAQQKAVISAKVEKFIAPVGEDSIRTKATSKGFDYEGAALSAVDQDIAAYAKDIEKLDRSISNRMKNIRIERGQLTEAEIQAGVTARGWAEEKIKQKEAEVESIQKVKAALEDLYKTQKDGEESVIAAKAKSRVENIKFRANEKAAAAENLRAQAIELAGEGKWSEAMAKRKESLEEFSKKLRYERIANRTEGNTQLPPIFDKLKLGVMGISSGVQVGAAAFMKFIPYIGAAVTAVGALYSAWEKWGKSEAAKAQSEALIKYKEAADTATKSAEELNRLNSLNISAGLKAAQTLTIQANATRGIADAMQEVLAAQAMVEKEGTTDFSFVNNLFNREGAISAKTGISTEDPMFSAIDKAYGGITSGSLDVLIQDMLPEELNGIDEQALETARSVATLTKIINKDLSDSFKLAAANGGTLEEGAKRIAESPALQREFIMQAAMAYDGLADVVKDLTDTFKQAGEAATEFITSAIPKTPFDNLLKSTRTILDGVTKLNKSVGATDADKLALLTQIPPEYAAFLDSKSQKLLQEVQLQSDIYNSLKAQADAGKELTSAQESQLKTARAFLETKDQERSIIENSIRVFEETLALNQAIEITNKSRIASVQAIMSANQEAYASGAAGEKARIEREEQIRQLQVAQLQAQKAMIDATIMQAEAAIKAAEAELLRLNITKDITREQVAQIEMYATKDLNAARAAALGGGLPESFLSKIDALISSGSEVSLSGMTDNQIQLGKSYAIAYRTFETAKKINETYEEAAAKNKTIATLKLQSASLAEEINNINQAGLSAEQKSARINAASVKLKTEIAAIENKNNSVTRSNAEIQKQINDLISGSAYEARYEATKRERRDIDSIKDIEEARARNLQDLSASRERAQADYNAAAAKGLTDEASGYKELLGTIDAKINLEKTSATLAIEEIKLVTIRADLEEILFDTRTRGLEIQIEALEVMRKQADLQSTLLSKEQELRKARRETEASRRGTEISPTAQKSEEYRTAVEVYNLALEQLELKKLEIELEYGLLEAKRLLMEQQLQVDKKRIDSEAAILRGKGDTKGANALEVMSNQLGAAYENINKFNYDALKQNALRIAELDVEILRQRAMKAYNDMIGSILPKNPASSFLQGISDAFEVFKAFDRTSMNLTAEIPKAISPAVIAQEAQIKVQQEQLKQLEQIEQNTSSDSGSVAANDNTAVEAVQTALKTIKLSDLIPSGNISSRFGSREAPIAGASTFHGGLDIKLGQGTPIYAPEDATVKFAETVRGYGKRLELSYETMEGALLTTYSHLSRFNVQAGQSVKKGDIVGFTGGKPGTPGAGVSTGPHLHFETLLNGKKIDPFEPVSIQLLTSIDEEIVVPGKRGKESEAARDMRLTREDKISKDIEEARANVEVNALAIEDRILRMSVAMSAAMQPGLNALKELGPQGIAVATALEGVTALAAIGSILAKSLGQTYEDFHKEQIGVLKKQAEAEGKVFDESTANLTIKAEFRAQKIASVFEAASAAIGVISSIMKASSDARIANIDKEIAAEQKRDGKSAQSVAKLDALEKKKDATARKAFNTNKKLMMAQAVMSTAAAIASTLATAPDPVTKIVMAGIIGAMGMAQIAVIAGTQYESSYSPKSISTPASVSIGKRGDSVNLAGGANANAGGEIGFLRGAQGSGTDASNYRTIGSAYGGDLMRGYGNRGFVVGEKGPEVISPETPLNVTPANDINTTQPLNATFNIQALDASGVQDILVSQKGNIIKMLRDAANASGQGFMEDVNVNVYTRPNIGKL